MGEHKHNLTAIKASNGEIPPKNKPNLSKRQQQEVIKQIIRQKTGIDILLEACKESYESI